MNKSFLILIFVLFSPGVFALGIFPGKNVVDFSPGLEKTFTLTVLNSNNEDIELVISMKGDLEDYVSVSERIINMKSNEPQKEIQVTINLPDELGPGPHSAELFVMQIPDEFEESGEMSVGAVVAVLSEIVVDVPYPGEYLDLELRTQNQEDGSVDFFLILDNRGKSDLSGLEGEITIFGSMNNEVASITTDKTDLNSGERKELTGTWTPNVDGGVYIAKAKVNYGKNVAEDEIEFTLGSQKLKLVGVEVNDFSLGGIAKFEVIVENTWNKNIYDAVSEMLIYDEGIEIAEVKSPSSDVKAGEVDVMKLFWDTEGINEGDYESTLFLKYPEGGEKKELTLEVSDDSISVIGFGYSISSLDVSGGKLVKILIGVIVFLVLVNLSWFMYLRKKIKK